MLEDLKVLDLKIIDSNGETIIPNAAEMYLTVKNAKTPGEGRDLSIIYLSDEEQVLINKELTEEKTDEPHISSPLQGNVPLWMYTLQMPLILWPNQPRAIDGHYLR